MLLKITLCRFAVLAGASESQLSSPGRDRLVLNITGSSRRTRSMVERILRMEETVSWLIVRNPLTRIVSAYRCVDRHSHIPETELNQVHFT